MGGHTCQVKVTREPADHCALASSITLWRLLTSEALNMRSPPHSPGYWPVMPLTASVYFAGVEAGSLLCCPETTPLPVIDDR